VVAHLLRLKLALLANGLRRSVWVVLGTVLGGMYGLGVLVTVAGAFVYVSAQPIELREIVAVVVGSAFVLVWWFVPLVAFGLDSTLDPARFATFPIPRRSLAVGLALAGLIGVPGVLTVLGAASTAVIWWHEPVAIPAALLGAALGVATCIVGSRATTTALAPLVVRRRVREVGVALLLVPIVLVGPLLSRLAPEGFDIRQADVEPLADALGWTPIGAAWALAPDVAQGRWWQAGTRLLVALATLAAIFWVWQRSLRHTLIEPVRETTKRRERGLGWFAVLPARPTGAVAARCLTYWVRDPRYAMAVVLIPVLPIVFSLVDPGGALPLVTGPLAGFLMGWAISADVAYDGTAFALHAAAPLPGRADRWGRALAAGALSVPVIAVVTVATALAMHRPSAIPALLGCGLGVAATALGIASVTSALVVYPVKQPGDNPFSVRQGATMPAFLTQMAGWVVVAAISVPVVVLTVLSVGRHEPGLGWAALAVGPAIGAVVLVVGVGVGGRILDRTAPDLVRRLLAMA
jgi:ABC-2 type transport system permease protein